MLYYNLIIFLIIILLLIHIDNYYKLNKEKYIYLLIITLILFYVFYSKSINELFTPNNDINTHILAIKNLGDIASTLMTNDNIKLPSNLEVTNNISSKNIILKLDETKKCYLNYYNDNWIKLENAPNTISTPNTTNPNNLGTGIECKQIKVNDDISIQNVTLLKSDIEYLKNLSNIKRLRLYIMEDDKIINISKIKVFTEDVYDNSFTSISNITAKNIFTQENCFVHHCIINNPHADWNNHNRLFTNWPLENTSFHTSFRVDKGISKGTKRPYIEIIFHKTYNIKQVYIINRLDGFWDRLDGFKLRAYDGFDNIVYTSKPIQLPSTYTNQNKVNVYKFNITKKIGTEQEIYTTNDREIINKIHDVVDIDNIS
jgi:hypothetical protein